MPVPTSSDPRYRHSGSKGVPDFHAQVIAGPSQEAAKEAAKEEACLSPVDLMAIDCPDFKKRQRVHGPYEDEEI